MMDKVKAVKRDEVALVGFTEVYSPKDPVFDIILIHSLGGDSRTTWTGPDKIKEYTYDDKGRHTGKVYVDADVYWPSQKPPTEARLLVFGYSSDVISFCGTESDKPSFLGIARDLVKGLLDLRRHSPLRPLIFVGHSLGGYIIKETLRLCRTESITTKSDVSLESIPQAIISIVFLCCPHVGSMNVSLAEAVETVLLSSGLDHARSLSDNFRTNGDKIRELHADFLAFMEDRAPMLKVRSVQEESTVWDGHRRITEPPMLEDATLILNHRYECFETAGCRFDDIPKLQYIRAWSVSAACRSFGNAVKSKWPENLIPAIRDFLPFRPSHPLVGREVEMESILKALTSRDEFCPRVGLLGTTGSGKTRMALELSHLLQNISPGGEASSGGKSVFYIQASTHANVEADFRRLASTIGLPSGDLFLHVQDWLNSKYSGDWVLIFDDVNDKRVFLNSLMRTRALPHTPTRSRLLDMIPDKKGCSVLFLSDNVACLKEILGQSHNDIIEVPPLNIPISMKILENKIQLGYNTNASTLESTSHYTKLSELFACNPVALIQAAQLVNLGHATVESFQDQANTVPSSKHLMSWPTRLAILQVKSTDPDCLKLLASLAALDVHKIAKWLIADFTPDFTPRRLETLQSLALINIKHNEEGTDSQSFIEMHSLVQDAVIASFSASEWAAHVRRTITRICHSFMLLSYETSPVIDFYTSAKSLTRHLNAVCAKSFAGHLNAIFGGKNPTAYVHKELDTFARFFQGDFSTKMLRQEVRKVFENVVRGDLNEIFVMLDYVNNRRGTGPDSRGSMPIYWYVGKEPQAQNLRSKYMYD